MDLLNLLTILVLAATVWTFLPEQLQDGLGPAVHRVADLVRAVARLVLRGLASGVRWLFGVDRVNHSDERVQDETPVLSSPVRTDGRTDGTGAPDGIRERRSRLAVDRTRAAIVGEMVDAGWTVEQIRGVVKGTNSEIGEEIKAARDRLPGEQRYPMLTKNGRRVASGK